MSKTLLCLDLSTNATGYAIFDIKSKKLKDYGVLKPKVAGISKLKYPKAALFKMIDMSSKIKDLITEIDPDMILIEEVNRGVNRISQKSLDALHFFVLDYIRLINEDYIDLIKYVDSNGKNGWRKTLKLSLSDADKDENKKIRLQNKKKRVTKKAVITWKTLAVRYANSKYKLKLCKDNDPKTDGDIADAICLGASYLK